MIESDLARNISVVLVQTQHSGNIGSAARAMRNMGLIRLKLVCPPQRWKEKATKMAAGALDLVDPIQVHASFDRALETEQVLVGTTSGRDRQNHHHVYTPRQIAPILRRIARTQKIALLFGPEHRGLTDQELSKCRYLVSVPSDDAYPVLNLAQTVTVLVYELNASHEKDLNVLLPSVNHAQREEMFLQMEKVLTEIGFLSSGNPGHTMKTIRRFLGRADLSRQDVQILRGILSQMEWYSRTGHRLKPEQVWKP